MKGTWYIRSTPSVQRIPGQKTSPERGIPRLSNQRLRRDRQVSAPLISNATFWSTYGIEFFGPVRTKSQSVEAINTHGVHVAVTREKDPYYDNKVSEDEDWALEIIAFAFAVNVRKKKDTEDDCDHVPLCEDEAIIGITLANFQPHLQVHCWAFSHMKPKKTR